MSAFASLVSTQPKKAARSVSLPVAAFAETWEERPSAAVEVGLRLVSEAEVQTAMAEANAYACKMHEGGALEPWIACYNDSLMRGIVARATCRPGDLAASWFDRPEDDIRDALTPAGLRLLWDELAALQVETSPLARGLDDDGVASLAAQLAAGALSKLPAEDAERVRRYLRVVAEALGG